jgi:hypothetical protein
VPWASLQSACGGNSFEPHEIEHFVAMLNQTRHNLSDAQVGALERQLQENAAKRKAAAH